MAKDAAALGVPSALISKMVQTAPGRVEWLTHVDLGSMNVSVFDDDTPTAVHRMNMIGARQIDRVAPPAPAKAPPPPTLQPAWRTGATGTFGLPVFAAHFVMARPPRKPRSDRSSSPDPALGQTLAIAVISCRAAKRRCDAWLR